MAKTNRTFEDEQVLSRLLDRFDLRLPAGADVQKLDVIYEAPVENAASSAQIVMKVVIKTDAVTADEILGVTG